MDDIYIDTLTRMGVAPDMARGFVAAWMSARPELDRTSDRAAVRTTRTASARRTAMPDAGDQVVELLAAKREGRSAASWAHAAPSSARRTPPADLGDAVVASLESRRKGGV